MDMRAVERYMLHDGKLWDWGLAATASTFGAQMALTGHVPALRGLARSLSELSRVPLSTHGCLLVTAGLVLSFATGARWKEGRFVNLLALLCFYLFASVASALGGCWATALTSATAAAVSAYRSLAVLRGGRHGGSRGRKRHSGRSGRGDRFDGHFGLPVLQAQPAGADRQGSSPR